MEWYLMMLFPRDKAQVIAMVSDRTKVWLEVFRIYEIIFLLEKEPSSVTKENIPCSSFPDFQWITPSFTFYPFKR